MSKNLLAVFVLCLLCCNVFSFKHLLSVFDNEFKQMFHHHNTGDTSKAFSIAMKIYVAVETLKGELEIEDAPVLLQADNGEDKSCDQLLSEIVKVGNEQNWL